MKRIKPKFRREVKYEDGEKFAKENDLIFFEASAKTAYNVDNVDKNIVYIFINYLFKIFFASAEKILKKIENKEIDPSNEVLIFNFE